MALATLEHDVQQIIHGNHPDPFRVLGMHRVEVEDEPVLVVRAFLPLASEASVVDTTSGDVTAMECVHPDGFFEATLPAAEPFRYRLQLRKGAGADREVEDPYAFGSTISDYDLYLLGEGTDLQMYDKLGAHPCTLEGVNGVRFAVWAPNAARASVVGSFNDWDGRRNPMRFHLGAGIWEIFVPELAAGVQYKYDIKDRSGGTFLKADPVAFQAELRPGTASVVHDRATYVWGDGDWMGARRGEASLDRPISIYEVHAGSWRRTDEETPLSYRELAHQLGDYAREMGFTHVELLPVAEHPYDPSWGYQVTGYFAPTSRYGTPDDFRYLIDHLHRQGIGVILDWVPAHFPRDEAGLRRFDGSALYEHADPRQGEQPDWGTLVFNFGRNEVRNFLIANALFWLDEYHIDGLRVDAVASMLYLDYSREEGEWVPNKYGGRENLEAIEFLKQLNTTVRDRFPGALMIAEESTAWPMVTQPAHLGGLGFHLKWNMGWMNDFLRFAEEDPVHRKYHFNLITFSLMYAFSEHFVLPLSHDEVVHGKRSLLGKMPGDDWQKFANLRLALSYMWGHPGKKLLFMGAEIGQWREWSENRSLDWNLLELPLHRGMQRMMRDLNALYQREPSLWQLDSAPEGFQWIDFHDVEKTIVSFLRRGRDGRDVIFVFNFTPVPRERYRVGVPSEGTYRELLNSDAEAYGGSNVGNGGGIRSEAVEEHGRPNSLCLTLPPLGALVLARDDDEPLTAESPS